VALLVVAPIIAILSYGNAYAAGQITNRSLTLLSGTGSPPDGGSKPGGLVKHAFAFTLPAVGNPNVGSILFQYCTTAAGACSMPSGLVTTSSTLGSQTGFGAGTFTLVNTGSGAPYLTRSSQAMTAGTAATVRLDDVTNPTTTNYSFFVRLTTYASNNASGSPIDAGTVTASTATQIILTGTMPESLVFCVGEQVLTTVGVPDCTTATAGGISFNNLFSPIDTAIAESQMAASTNAGFGYAITVNGNTLQSGGNSIAAMASATTSNKNVSQFGMNLMANTSTASASFPGTVAPYISANVAPAANVSGGNNFRGQPKAGYDTQNTFKFADGDTVAASDFSSAGASDSQIFTASYIVNVPGSQAAGTYTTTLTYICTASF
jgi:hypothetical protein